MSGSIPDAARAGDLSFLDEQALADWMLDQRWFASKAREVSEFHVTEAVALADGEPLLVIAVVEARFTAGTHELYQVPLGLRHRDEGWSEGVIAAAGDRTVYDAMTDPACTRRLVAGIRDGATLERDEATWCFRTTGGLSAGVVEAEARPMGVEQSNSSIVIGDELMLKVYRRIAPGPNPELELLRFLTEHGFEHIARLVGWYEHRGRLLDATLGILEEFLPAGKDGWDLALDSFTSGDVEGFLDELGRLGAVTAEMHSVLGSDASDPAFAADEPSGESIALLLATVDEEIERVFRDLPDTPEVAPVAGRGQEVREHVRALAHVGSGGRTIRTHGDFHLGQALLTERGWSILDFEGEPARSLTERRQKRSPLRDVAGMLRSFAYAASAAEPMRGVAAPDDWEQQARERFMSAYLETVDQSLVPHGEQNVRKLLLIFELEKAVYELRYELNNRPDWVGIPVAGIARLLEEAVR